MSTMLIDRKTVDLALSDGSVVTVAADVADSVVGVDFEGDLIARAGKGLRLLTPCCNMPGVRGEEPAGAETQVICSGCEYPVDEGFHPSAITEQADVVLEVRGRAKDGPS